MTNSIIIRRKHEPDLTYTFTHISLKQLKNNILTIHFFNSKKQNTLYIHLMENIVEVDYQEDIK